MALLKLITFVFAASIIVQARHHKRESTSNICDPAFNNTNSVQCFCVLSPKLQYRTANCHLAKENVSPNDPTWNAFQSIEDTRKLTLSNTNGINLKYIPTNIFTYLRKLIKLDIKSNNIEAIESFAFGNSSSLADLMLCDNQIKTVAISAFAHLRNLVSINLDTNNLKEINRDVFRDLPSLERLYLTNNKIATLHDRAFVHLQNLRELEIDRNIIFSLNVETFNGLSKLQKLSLSSNSLEVIGDNTFLPLTELKILNLEKNKLQMLDEKAFSGLSRLSALSLAHNNLKNIDNAKVFEGLTSLEKLSFKGNQLKEIKTEVMAPILSNFYGNGSVLEIEDNNLPCDCRLEWMISLNNTQSVHLKLAIENLKCIPDTKVRDLWTKSLETEKTKVQAGEPVFNEEDPQANGDYEYYDEPQQNGTLFYTDIRDLINCTNTTTVTTAAPKIYTKVTTSPTINPSTTQRLFTQKPTEGTIVTTELTNKQLNNQVKGTTDRLATVSAKPLNKMDDLDFNMASDEARPGKAHRSVQEELKETKDINTAPKCLSSALVVSILLCVRIFLF